MTLRHVDDVMAQLRAVAANPAISGITIETGELMALCDEITRLRKQVALLEERGAKGRYGD